MGAKHLKAIVIEGNNSLEQPEGKEYPALYKDIFRKLTDTDMMRKYHNLGTASNLEALNELKALPWRNLQATSDPGIEGITGERFADDTLLRNSACAGCPVGCIHIGFVREKFHRDNRYVYRQVGYDYEPIFATGSMLGLTSAPEVLTVMDEVEKAGLDVMSGGVALAWATEALEKGVVTTEQTGIDLRFGEVEGYINAVHLLAEAENEFWKTLAAGTSAAAKRYGERILPASLARRWPDTPRARSSTWPSRLACATRTWTRAHTPTTNPTPPRTWTRPWPSCWRTNATASS